MVRERRPKGLIELSEFDDDQLRHIASAIRIEQKQRSIAEEEPDTLGMDYLERLGPKEPGAPEAVGKGLIALGGLIKYNSSGTRHTCNLFSVYIPGMDAFWAWEDGGTLAFSHSTKVGDVRQSVAVHTALSDMILIRHTMKHDGERHTRITERAWECYWGEDGNEPLSIIPARNYVAQTLPVPNH